MQTTCSFHETVAVKLSWQSAMPQNGAVGVFEFEPHNASDLYREKQCYQCSQKNGPKHHTVTNHTFLGVLSIMVFPTGDVLTRTRRKVPVHRCRVASFRKK